MIYYTLSQSTADGQYGRVGAYVTSLAEVGRGHGPARVTTLHQRTAVTTVLVLIAALTSVCLMRVQVRIFFDLNMFI